MGVRPAVTPPRARGALQTRPCWFAYAGRVFDMLFLLFITTVFADNVKNTYWQLRFEQVRVSGSKGGAEGASGRVARGVA